MKHVFWLIFWGACSRSGAGVGVTDTDGPTDTDETTTSPTTSPALGIPDGLLAYFDAETCPEGWSEFTPARGRALVAVLQPDEIGVTVATPLDTEVPLPHGHSLSVTFDIPGAGIAGSTSCCNTEPGASGAFTVEGDLESADSDVPTIALRVCRRDRTEGPPEAGLSLPTGASAFVDATSCPEGMSPALDAEGRFVLGQGASGVVGQQVGDPLASGEVRVHEHTATLSVEIPERSLALAGGGNDDHASKGTFEAVGTSGIGNLALPYLQTLFCEVDSAATSQGGDDEQLPSGAILFANTPECPEVWVDEESTVGRFVLGQPSGVFVGSTHGTALEVGEDRTHDHAHALALDLPSLNIAGISGCCNGSAGQNGTYALSGEIDPASRGLPYIALRACTRP